MPEKPSFPRRLPTPKNIPIQRGPRGRGAREPKYCRQRRADGYDLAFVMVNGKRHYLGRYDSPESRQAYHRLMAELVTNGTVEPVPQELITVVEVAERYMTFARGYYQKNGQLTAEPANIALALRWVLALHGRTPAAEFGPKALKIVREKFVEQKFTRKYINRHVDRIKRMFKWAVAEELIPASVYHGLQAVTGLRYGRTQAKEPEPVRPVSEDLIAPVKKFVSRQIAAMIDLQMLTGGRPGEIVIMRPMDIDRSGEVWLYVPARHKTQHHGHHRTIPLGPKAQAVIAPFLESRAPDAYMFSPYEAERERYAAKREARVTPTNVGNGPGKRPAGRPLRILGDYYDRTSYARGIARGCELAFPLPEDLRPPVLENGKPMSMRDFLRAVSPEKREAIQKWRRTHHWHPHQLRHNYATNVRKLHGLEIAQILLGHAKADVTQVYAERDMKRAIDVAKDIG